MRELLAPLLTDGVAPNHFDETRWLLAYLNAGEPHGAALMLSLGEAWSGPPAGLLAALQSAPTYAHGYQLSMYGLPALRACLARLVADTQLLAAGAEGSAYDIGVSWCGTRSAMSDFGRWLVDKGNRGTGTPTLVATYPGWEYDSVFRPLGFRFAPFLLRESDGFRPDADALLRHLQVADREARGAPRVIAVNAQHNPTGIDWSPEVVRAVVRFSLERGWALLLDDAHYGIHPEGYTPTSALHILMEEAGADSPAPVPWLAVRSLGKQFACNGWGLGVMVAPPSLMEDLVLRIRPQHQYNYSGHSQWAMALWLDGPEPARYTAEYRSRVQQNRMLVARRLREELGYPESTIFAGACTSFMLYPLPLAFRTQQDSGARFARMCLERTGVLLSAGALLPPRESSCAVPYARVFIGAPTERLTEALDRISAAALGWDCPVLPA